MSEIAFVVRLGLHGLTATLALLFSLSIEVVDGSPDQLAALAGLVVVAVAAGAAAETAWRVWRSKHSVDGAAAIENAPDGPAHRDALTGLPSRDAFRARLKSILEGQRRSDRMVAVLALEFADLRTISATLGGAAADLVVRHASTRLLAILRDTDMLARLGAGELAVIQSDIEDPARAWALCERLAAVLDEPLDLCGRLSGISARIGVAIGPSDGQDPETLLGHARLARSRGKSARRTFRFYQDVLDAKLRERRAFERDLANALAHEEFQIEYQPQIDIASRRMVGVEALLRWNHPARGRIEPDRFIPLAEDTGLIVPIGAWVLEQACAQAVRWHQAGAPRLRMSVNMSPLQFRHPELVDAIAGILTRTGLPGECLELEITERVLMQDTLANLEMLRRLKGLGIRISIDDFGVGHSSLGYLRRFPFDEIKLDRSFVSALEHDPTVAAIVRATLSLGRSLGMVSVAEGVESARQLTLLDTEDCCIAQGFYFSPPVPAGEIELMIRAAATPDSHDFLTHELPRAS